MSSLVRREAKGERKGDMPVSTATQSSLEHGDLAVGGAMRLLSATGQLSAASATTRLPSDWCLMTADRQAARTYSVSLS